MYSQTPALWPPFDSTAHLCGWFNRWLKTNCLGEPIPFICASRFAAESQPKNQ